MPRNERDGSPAYYSEYPHWREAIVKSCGMSANWEIIGEWAYSTFDTQIREHQQLYHLCTGSHKAYLDKPDSSDGAQVTIMDVHTHCVSCNAVVPDGLKMIVMLLESDI